MTDQTHEERMRELRERLDAVLLSERTESVRDALAYADELHAELEAAKREASYQRMTRDVFEEKLNEYIDKVRDAERDLTSEREARRRAEALLDDVKQAASESAADTYYRRDQCDAGEHWQVALEDIVARIDKAKEAPSGETKECGPCLGTGYRTARGGDCETCRGTGRVPAKEGERG